jgi:uncharacterized protein YyaL (SSP411 family)
VSRCKVRRERSGRQPCRPKSAKFPSPANFCYNIDMKRTFLSFLCAFFLMNQVTLASEFRFSPRPNRARLIHWRLWDKASFDKARNDGKPILLSLSAVWCHWCHVMDETTYSDDGVIRFINENFIPVRVDADMRPDIDGLYNQGGWPSTVVFSPGGVIVRGGTYIAAEEMIPWLAQALASYRRGGPSYGREPGETTPREGGGSGTMQPAKSDIARVVGYLKSEYDRENGGFGRGQKFPNPGALDFLLSEYVRSGDKEAAAIVTKTLDEMRRGEIRDRVEGGFFRYATGRNWSAPHYEKMLEANAEIARNYAFAYQVFENPSYKTTLKETVGYVRRSLFDRKKGVFYGSQDADEKYYAAAERGGMRRPYVDTTIYAGPNARMISALVAAYGATGSRDLIDDAIRTADFMITELYSREDGVCRSRRDGRSELKGLLADNVLFGLALVDLYGVSGNRKYIAVAQDIGRLLERRFFDPSRRRFRSSLDATLVQPSTAGLLAEYTKVRDNFEAAVLCERLSRVEGTESLRRMADAVMSAMHEDCEKFGPAAALCGAALTWQLREPFEVLVVSDGDPGRFLAEVNRVFVPDKVVRVLSLKTDAEEIRRLGYPPEEALYLCAGRRCLASVKRPQDVRNKVREFLKAFSSAPASANDKEKGAGHGKPAAEVRE